MCADAIGQAWMQWGIIFVVGPYSAPEEEVVPKYDLEMVFYENSEGLHYWGEGLVANSEEKVKKVEMPGRREVVLGRGVEDSGPEVGHVIDC